ncbi:hypothetical protein KUV50_00255 [Membranicola marinus]|uniref:Uncharacterized protein n=1 Tax=Membranihabitans marinus TaxID=1227546 RepID=A0A953HQH9_9BACT|nr:hypothetical protein [Membranihabitans marinus]MBY5956545.1 hypothetical protein [Membranihabitans marinus]
MSCWLLSSCQPSGKNPKFSDPRITANIRYLESSGELSGTWSFYQRNQVDSLVPDARLHEFIINGQKVKSEKVKNNYHMYLMNDTLISHNLNVQIQPSNQVISIAMPYIPVIESELLQVGLDWTFTWDSLSYNVGDSIRLVLSDSTKKTVLTNASGQAGQITIPYTQTRYLTPGSGFYYLISKSIRRKKTNGVDFEYEIEVYSDDVPVKIMSWDN